MHVTHCDKKPRGKVGGSAISVYQALLHSPIESLGTRLYTSIFSTVSTRASLHEKSRESDRGQEIITTPAISAPNVLLEKYTYKPH